MTELRQTMLKVFNNLNTMFISIEEARDIHLSDIRNLEESLWTLRKEFGIIPQKDKQGTPMWYADYILEKEKTNARKKK